MYEYLNECHELYNMLEKYSLKIKDKRKFSELINISNRIENIMISYNANFILLPELLELKKKYYYKLEICDEEVVKSLKSLLLRFLLVLK